MSLVETDRSTKPSSDVDVDVLVIGAGVVGIYQLYRLREAGFDVMTLEAGDGVGGVWYWNRYPGARFDSESFTYGYIFSRELFADWKWKEIFAGQEEIESYFNHVVDRFDLRRHIRFGERVVSTVYDEASQTWEVRTEAGTSLRARVVIATTGGLSVPFLPEIPGRDDFGGESHHTGQWPKTPVDFKGKRVAVIGTGPSGMQIVPEIVDEVAELTIYQRTPNWVTPLNNKPLTDEEHQDLVDRFDTVQRTLLTAPSGFLHPPVNVASTDLTPEQRREFFEELWKKPGFSKLTSNLTDIRSNPEVNREWCAFIEGKIREIVKDPDIVEKLIPRDHLFGGKRPPYDNGYLQALNAPHVSMVDIKATPITRITETGIETSEGLRELDIIVWATGFDFGTGALTRMGIRGRDGLAIEEHWAEGPATCFGFMSRGFPNLFFPGGPHGAGGGNYPRYASDQVDFVTSTLVFMREHDEPVIEPSEEVENEWMQMVSDLAPTTIYSKDHSHYYGANIPGKPRRYLLNPGGRNKLREMTTELANSGYAGFLGAADRNLVPASSI